MPFRTYLINRFTNERFRLNGLKRSIRLPLQERLRQLFADHIIIKRDELPPKVDLRSQMTEIENQSKIGSCAANTLAGAYEYLLKKTNGSNTDVSRLFIYYTGRSKKKDAGQITDKGCSMTNAIEALQEYGACLESDWPYDISKVNEKPNDDAYEKAKDRQITEAFRVNIDLNEMKSCLAQGYPFAFGLRLYKSFDKATKGGVVPMPSADEKGRSEHGRHAMLAVGYSDQSKCFIVRNSWGKAWGDQGYCYIPYEYMTNSAFCFDAWTIRQFEIDNLGSEHWDHDDSIDYQLQAVNDDNEHYRIIEKVKENDGDTTSTSSSSSSDV